MRNLNMNEIALVSGASTSITVNTPNPNHFTSAFVAGMKGESHFPALSMLIGGVLGGAYAMIVTNPYGVIPVALAGAGIGAIYDAVEYYYGQNYAEVQKFNHG